MRRAGASGGPLVVVGGGPAAHAAATAYRAAGGGGRVVMIAAEGREPYERPPLSKEALRHAADLSELPMPEAGEYAALGIEVVAARATALDPARRVVRLQDGRERGYAACVLATGAEPVRPSKPGFDLEHVHVLRAADESAAIAAATPPGSRVAVVGSGFIGCEAAASLALKGCAVALVTPDRAPQAARLGDEVADRLAAWLRDSGVDARYETTLDAVDSGGALRTTPAQGLRADVVLLAVGVRPAAELAQAAGLTIAAGGEVAADDALRTSAPGIWAAGDCCRARHALAGRPLHVEHWGDALDQGEVAGANAAGARRTWRQVPGFWSTIGERTLKYAAWADGHDEVRVDGGPQAFTAWYGAAGRCVGVLTHERDEDYEHGRELIAAGAALPR